MKYKLFANELKTDHFWHTSPNLSIAKLYGGILCEVQFTESKNGIHYGWLNGVNTYPTMIYPNEVLFSMCFPYGYKVLEEKGEGRHVRLDAKLLRVLDN